jgi:3-methyladenine DNA glycosylase/8-oxoguanine DNA glycosylase
VSGPLLQERLGAEDPFRVLACCVLMNLGSGARAAPVAERLFRRWPTPERLARAGRGLELLLQPLGLQRVRADRLRRLAGEYVHAGADRRTPAEVVAALHGVGSYARDSWAIFVEGRLDVEPDDKELRRRLEALRGPGDAAVLPAPQTAPDASWDGVPAVVEPPTYRRTFWEALADSEDEGEAVLRELLRP